MYTINPVKSRGIATAVPKTKPLVRVTNAAKKYIVGKQTINALDGVSLEIYQGEFVAITGSSGSGKSTLLQLLGGLDKPNQGSVAISGTDLNRLSDTELSAFRNQTIGFVFQSFYLQPFLSLYDNLAVPAVFANMSPAEQGERIAAIAHSVGLTERLHHLPKELSGGQMQRAAIARALINKPKLILADEPTGNLDSANGAIILGLFQKARSELGTTIVMVTHDQAIAAKADRCISMKDGRIIR